MLTMSTETASNPTPSAEAETGTTAGEWIFGLVSLALAITGIILAWVSNGVSNGGSTAMDLRSWHSWNALCLVMTATGARKLCNCYRTPWQSDACDCCRFFFILLGFVISGCGCIGYPTTTVIILMRHAQGVDGVDGYMLASAIIAVVQAGFIVASLLFCCAYRLIRSDRNPSDDAERRY